MARELYVEKTVIIGKPIEKVFDFLKLMENQNEFSVWVMKDLNKKSTLQGTDGTVGSIYSWDSKDKNVGAGSQQIIKMVNDELIEYDLRFERPMKNTAKAKFTLKSLSPQQTEVKWDFKGPTKFPMSLFKGMLQNMLGKDMVQSLNNLKAKLESQ